MQRQWDTGWTLMSRLFPPPHLAHILFFFFLNLFIYLYLFLAVLGLRFCARAFSICGEQGPLFIAVRSLAHILYRYL